MNPIRTHTTIPTKNKAPKAEISRFDMFFTNASLTAVTGRQSQKIAQAITDNLSDTLF